MRIPVLISNIAMLLGFFVTLSLSGSKNHVSVKLEGVREKKYSQRLIQLRTKAYDLARNRSFEAAIAAYTAARRQAITEGATELAVQFLTNIASCHYSIYAYRDAIQIYKQALKEAKDLGDRHLEALVAINMESIYLSMGEDESAADIVQLYPLDGSASAPASRLDAFLIQASVFTRLKRKDQAEKAFARAIDEADRDPPPALVQVATASGKRWPESIRELRRAWAYTVISECLNWRGDFALAEPYILEAFRLRTTYREHSNLRNILQLAIVQREKRNFATALQLLAVSRNVDSVHRTPMHDVLLDREVARTHLAAGNVDAAVPYISAALTQARRWRVEVLPTDAAFLNFESYLTNEFHRTFLDALCSGSLPLDRAAIAEESFWVAEEARFASMRAAQFPATAFANHLPQAYWTKFAELQRRQTEALRGDRNASASLALTTRELNRIEMESGFAIPHSNPEGAPAVADWRRKIPGGEVVFSYYLSEPYSLAWLASPAGVRVRRIAGKRKLAGLIERFRAEIMNSSQNETSSTGLELSRQLFGEFLYSHRTTQYWTMVIDQELATLPIAALPAGPSGSRFLIQDHTLRVLPSAISLQNRGISPWQGTAIGIADPIYNQGDLRLAKSPAAAAPLLELTRLPASAQELQKSMAVMNENQWTTRSWTGNDASATHLRAAFQDSPDIIHLSTHFVSDAANPNLLSIALTPSTGSHSLFSALDLNSVRTQTKLIVLSGCNSSSGQMVSGIAINGLARACLISGAGAVLATLWPTVDSDGPIFPVFYNHLLHHQWSQRAAADSLRAAQMEMIRRGGWTSRPAYWAAYLAISKG